MEHLIIAATDKTPEINFNFETGKLLVAGRSYSSDTYDFYKPVNEWLTKYLENPKEETKLEINVDYFHSVSIKYLTTIIKKVAELQETSKAVAILWYHQPDENNEDEAFDLGKSLERQSKLKFEFVKIV